MVRDLNGIAGVFLRGLARDAAMVVREGGVQRFGAVAPVMPGEPTPPPPPPSSLGDSLHTVSVRAGCRRTIGTDDVLAATRMQLFGGNLRQRALLEARKAAQRHARS